MWIQNRLGMSEGIEAMRAQEERMNQIANNLANVDTVGYKREEVTFWEMLFDTADRRPRVGKALRVITDGRQGPTVHTGNPFDLLIDGEGFFRVQTPNGVRYTRAGNFTTDATGQLVTQDGYPVLGTAGTIVVGHRDFTVDSNGDVRIDGELVNRLEVVAFDDPTSLEKEGGNLFRPAAGGGAERPAADYQVIQGALEQSNVNTAIEMTEMIDLQRAYQAQQKVIHTIDEIDGLAVNRVGKLNT